MTLRFGRWQAQEAGICVIIIVQKSNTRASSPLHVGLHGVLHRFTKEKRVQYVIEHKNLRAASKPVSLQFVYFNIFLYFNQFEIIIHLHITWFVIEKNQ